MRFKDMPGSGQQSQDMANKVLHAALPISKETILMGSDTDTPRAVTAGNNFSISVNAKDQEEAGRLFKGLSAGGKVTMPMQETFWGAYFGMLTDKFGIQWMVNCELKKET